MQCAPRPFHVTIAAYSIVLSSFGCLLELGCCGPLERRVELWNKMLRRAWGRAALYLLIAIMQFAQQTLMGNVASAALLGASLFSLAVSCTATRKLSHLRDTLRARLLDDPKSDTDEARLRTAFDKIDTTRSGALAPNDFARVAAELGVALQPGSMVKVPALAEPELGSCDSLRSRSAALRLGTPRDERPGHWWSTLLGCSRRLPCL